MATPTRRSKWDQGPEVNQQSLPSGEQSQVPAHIEAGGPTNGATQISATSDAVSKAAAFLSSNLGGPPVSSGPVGWLPPGEGDRKQATIYSGEVNINGCRPEIRYVMTNRDTFDQIEEEIGATVITRGTYRPSDNANMDAENPEDKPLHLYVTADSQEKVDKACAKLKILMERPSTTPSGLLMNKVFITFAADADPAFSLVGKIIGPKGSFVKHIQQVSGCKVHLRGRGSSYMEVNSRAEAPEPLHLFITGPTEDQVQQAKVLSEKLIANVKSKYDAYLAEKRAGFPPHDGSRSPGRHYDPHGPLPPGSGGGPPSYHSGSPNPHGNPPPPAPSGNPYPPQPPRDDYRGGPPSDYRNGPPSDRQGYPPQDYPRRQDYGGRPDDHYQRGPRRDDRQTSYDRRGPPPPSQGPSGPPQQPQYPAYNQTAIDPAAQQAMTYAAYGYGEWTPEAIAAYYAYYGYPQGQPAAPPQPPPPAQPTYSQPGDPTATNGHVRRFQEAQAAPTVPSQSPTQGGEDMDMEMSDDEHFEPLVNADSRAKRPHHEVSESTSAPDAKRAKYEDIPLPSAYRPAQPISQLPPSTDKPFWASTTSNRSNVLLPSSRPPSDL